MAFAVIVLYNEIFFLIGIDMIIDFNTFVAIYI